MNIRTLQRQEIPLVWQIDRREIVQNIYNLENGTLVLKPGYFDIQGWPPIWAYRERQPGFIRHFFLLDVLQ